MALTPMDRPTRMAGITRALLTLAGFLFCAVTTLHAVLWMYDVRRPENPVEIGINAAADTHYEPETSTIPIYDVVPGSPAAVAGLKPGDKMVAINGKEVTSFGTFQNVWGQSMPGEMVHLRVKRPGMPDPLAFDVRFRATTMDKMHEGVVEASARWVTNLYPVLFLLVGFTVLFFRLEDPMAWLLAALFACFIAVPAFPHLQLLPEPIVRFVNVFHAFFASMLSGVFYTFFALFPQRSRLERRAPWLKWVALFLGVLQAVPGLKSGHPHWPAFLQGLFGEALADSLHTGLNYVVLGLGIVSLLMNSFGRDASIDTRRKSRVILWGTLVGVLPILLQRLVSDFSGYQPSFWAATTMVVLVLLYPLSFAYAVVKHRVLEIPALLRRSARYVLVQRGFFVLIVVAALAAIYVFTHLFTEFFRGHSQVGMGLSAVFGVALVWVSGPIVKRGTERIDRAFFRGSYDARVILQDLAEQLRTVTDRKELANLLEDRLTKALHPKALAIYSEAPDGSLLAICGTVPPEATTIRIDPSLRQELTGEHGRTWDVPTPDAPDYPTDAALAGLAPQVLVPLLARDSRLIGMCVLGEPLSEEPYSREDKRLLESVAGQAAAALENIGLAERMADRIEAERSAAREMQIARDVQSRLFPRTSPPLATLDYVGDCIQARQVGGDYYDFLPLGENKMAFILADISGKGIAGALLMANLQANFRSRQAAAMDDLPGLLQSVNQLFYENSPEDRYATMFVAVYDDVNRRLRYANCGHNPPLVFRVGGAIEKLAATASVVGLFVPWESEMKECVLAPGDVLVIYTDGVTEAEGVDNEEFGEARLIATVRADQHAAPMELLRRIQDSVQGFSVGEQFDDLTLVVARAK